jgi:hypothetical protein
LDGRGKALAAAIHADTLSVILKQIKSNLLRRFFLGQIGGDLCPGEHLREAEELEDVIEAKNLGQSRGQAGVLQGGHLGGNWK